MEEFERLAIKAYKEIPLTEFAILPERYAYFRLKEMYYRFKCGDYTQEQAQQIKAQIKKEYGQDSKEYDTFRTMFKEYNNNRIQNETLLYYLEKETDKDKMLDVAINIISNVVGDETMITRFKQKSSKIDF